jgi:dolichol-phosphate mannosyltransferase
VSVSTDQPVELDIVIPVYNEGANILRTLGALRGNVRTPYRVMICYDREDDDTLAALAAVPEADARPVALVKNEGKGTHGAVMTGLSKSSAPYVAIFMADDDFNGAVLDSMVAQARTGAEVVCASRFMPGGCMVGCPWLKALLVRTASSTLRGLAQFPTRDATNGFRLFSQRIVSQVEVESREGFTYSLELTAKAHRLRWKIVEVPAHWFERREGTSRFKVLKWLPAYLRWYGYVFATTWLRRGPATVPMRG